MKNSAKIEALKRFGCKAKVATTDGTSSERLSDGDALGGGSSLERFIKLRSGIKLLSSNEKRGSPSYGSLGVE